MIFAQGELLRKARGELQKYLNYRFKKKSHPIRILIEASAGPEDARQKSRWTQALRYAFGWIQPAKKLKWFFKVNGGISGSARKYALNKKTARHKNGGGQNNIIHQQRGLGDSSELNAAAGED